jgi:hypothetical protein
MLCAFTNADRTALTSNTLQYCDMFKGLGLTKMIEKIAQNLDINFQRCFARDRTLYDPNPAFLESTSAGRLSFPLSFRSPTHTNLIRKGKEYGFEFKDPAYD